MKIHIETIPKSENHHCGYLTCGDWWYDQEAVLQIRVTDTGNNDSNVAVMLHELIEARYCKVKGISEQQVCQFDIQYEKERSDGKHTDTDEPGEDQRCPYFFAHQGANHVERAVCNALNILWSEHNDFVNNAS